MNMLYKVRELGATQPGVMVPLGRQLEMLGVSFLFLASFVTVCSRHGRNPYSRESLIPSGAPQAAHPASSGFNSFNLLSEQHHWYTLFREPQVGFLFSRLVDLGPRSPG